MTSIVKTFSGRDFRTGRDRIGEPLPYNDRILSQMNTLLASLNPGDELWIEKEYSDGTLQTAHLMLTNEGAMIKSGDLPMDYCALLGFPVEGWHLAADLSKFRSKIKSVVVSVTFAESK